MGTARRGLLAALLVLSMQPSTATGDTWASWMTSAGNAVTEALTASKGRTQKLRKVSQSSTNESDKTRSEETEVTTSYVQGMVAEGVAAAMRVMGNATDQRFKGIETSLQRMQGIVTNMSDRLEDLAGTTTPAPEEINKMRLQIEEAQEREEQRQAKWKRLQAESQKQVQEMKTLRDEVKAAAAAAAASVTLPPGLGSPARTSASRNSESNSSSSTAKIPYEDRREAIIADL